MADNEVSTRLSGIHDQREAGTAIRRLEEYATPAEFALANGVESHLTEAGRQALRNSYAGRFMRHQSAEPYVRTALAANAFLYRGPSGAPEGKTLVIALAGAAQRLMVPVGVFLQCLPAAGHDLVLVRDPGRNHYDLGVPGYADSLLATAQRLRSDLDIGRYRRVVTLGSSMGGLPALRLGVLLEADLAISLGGRPIWHVDRLISPKREAVSAFDVLCVCGPPGADLLLVYAGLNDEDGEGPDMLAKARPVHRIKAPCAEHNILRFVVGAGLAQTFLPAVIAGNFGVASEILDFVFFVGPNLPAMASPAS